MTVFNQWTQAFWFTFWLALIIIVPCIFTIIWGRRMIDKLGMFPSQAYDILLEPWKKFFVLQLCTFFALWVFSSFFINE